MIHNKVHRLVYAARDRGIELGYSARDDIVLNDPRDLHAFRQIAESLGFRQSGSDLTFNDPAYVSPMRVSVTDQESEARLKADRAAGKRYGSWTA
jgi:hypothetical protein